MTNNVISIVPDPQKHRNLLKQMAEKFYDRASSAMADHDLKAAEEHYLTAVEHYNNLGLAHPRMLALKGLYECYDKQGNLARSSDTLALLVKQNDELGFYKEAAENERLLAGTLLAEKHIDPGFEAMERAAKRMSDLGQDAQAAGMYVELGDLCRKELQRIQQAREYYLKAVDLHAATNYDNTQHAYCHNVLGIVSEKLGRPADAQQHYSEGASIYLKLLDYKGSGICTRNIGHLLMKQDQPMQALFYFRKALVRFSKQNLHVFEAATQEAIGNAHQQLDNLQAAQQAWQKAVQFFEKAGEVKSAKRLRDKYDPVMINQ